MTIRMRTTAAGPNGVMSAGSVYEVDSKTAKALIDGGYAEKVEQSAKPAVKAEETAKDE